MSPKWYRLYDHRRDNNLGVNEHLCNTKSKAASDEFNISAKGMCFFLKSGHFEFRYR